MSRSYFTEDSKMFIAPITRWTIEESCLIQDILLNKGYEVNVVSRVGCDRKQHDALRVQRSDIPRLIEQCFRQRLVVEVQAEGHGKASINFVYDHYGEDIIRAVKKFWKNNSGDAL